MQSHWGLGLQQNEFLGDTVESITGINLNDVSSKVLYQHPAPLPHSSC